MNKNDCMLFEVTFCYFWRGVNQPIREQIKSSITVMVCKAQQTLVRILPSVSAKRREPRMLSLPVSDVRRFGLS